MSLKEFILQSYQATGLNRLGYKTIANISERSSNLAEKKYKHLYFLIFYSLFLTTSSIRSSDTKKPRD